jgi:hypothetical protein
MTLPHRPCRRSPEHGPRAAGTVDGWCEALSEAHGSPIFDHAQLILLRLSMPSEAARGGWSPYQVPCRQAIALGPRPKTSARSGLSGMEPPDGLSRLARIDETSPEVCTFTLTPCTTPPIVAVPDPSPNGLAIVGYTRPSLGLRCAARALWAAIRAALRVPERRAFVRQECGRDPTFRTSGDRRRPSV